MDISPLSDRGMVKILYHFVGCCLVLLTVSFALQRLFNFMRSHLSIVDLRTWAISALFRKFYPLQMCWRLFPPFSSIRFSVSGFMWRFLTHVDLSIVQGSRSESIGILLHVDWHLNQHHLLNMLSVFHWKSLAIYFLLFTCLGCRCIPTLYDDFLVFLFFAFYTMLSFWH